MKLLEKLVSAALVVAVATVIWIELNGPAGRAAAQDKAVSKPKVLYFTHEPGRYHKYKPQKEIFVKLAEKAGWDVTVWTGSYKEQVAKLRTPDFGRGYHAIVYNFCFAKSKDLEAASNLMKQTRVHGVPAMLIHCSMHSWWPTFKRGKPGLIEGSKARTDPKLLAEWKKKNPDVPFPAWGDFTGVASGGHGPKKPITMNIVEKNKNHPAVAGYPDGFKTGNTELYNNIYVTDDVVPLIEGVQGRAKAIVMWTAPQGKSQVLGLTLGHGVGDWEASSYHTLITNSVNYLIKNPKP
ncbi:MAG: hypothetical protein R3236_05725 [Phycisphaeraceae bacterium]|nr:hypothetical protein [Phycisphaeraceae bacterium]